MIKDDVESEELINPSEKWEELANAGYQPLPDILLKKQKELGLSPTDLVVLINLSMYWWYADKRPYPHLHTIAKHMGVEVRTVQRAIKRLCKLGLLSKEKEQVKTDDIRTVYDFKGLIRKLTPYALKDVGYRPRIKMRKVN